MNRKTVALLHEGGAAHQRGDLGAAERAYHRVLELDAENPGAIHGIGLIAYQRRRFGDAVGWLRRAVALEPANAHYHNHLGEALRLNNEPAAAGASFRHALRLQASFPEALSNLGLAEGRLGNARGAEECFREALRVKPGFADAANNLGALLLGEGRIQEAIASLQHAVRHSPGSIHFAVNLGLAYEKNGQIADAVAVFEAIVARHPDARALHALGRIEIKRGHGAKAVAWLERLRVIQPDDARVVLNLGRALQAAGRFEDAAATLREACSSPAVAALAEGTLGTVERLLNHVDAARDAYQRSLALDPTLAEVWNNLGVIEQESGHLSEAVGDYEKALALRADYPEAQNNLGNVWVHLGRIDQALRCYDAAVARLPTYFGAHSNRLMALLYSDAFTPEEVFRQHRDFGRSLGLPPPLVTGVPAIPGQRPLRIGILSADLCTHPVTTFFEPALAAPDPQVEFHAYADVMAPDAVTERLRKKFNGWRDIGRLSDLDAARQIKADGIDVLVELGGHTARSRLFVCAFRPAAIQATYLGYPSTTGLPMIDYRLTDQLADPTGQTEQWHTERLAYIADCAWCFQPPAAAPESVPPVSTRSRLRFGSFNAVAKISPTTKRMWVALLQKNPEAELWLKARFTGDKLVHEALRADFIAAGVEDRVRLLPYRASAAEHYADYGEIDVCLDPFPYHGTTTTCEALWMGVPVVTLAGTSHVSRVGVSLLAQVGLTDCVVSTPDEYIAKASALLADGARRNSLRASLRATMQASPLMDAKGFSGRFSACLRQLVERHSVSR